LGEKHDNKLKACDNALVISVAQTTSLDWVCRHDANVGFYYTSLMVVLSVRDGYYFCERVTECVGGWIYVLVS
jgi:hypothetical protein